MDEANCLDIAGPQRPHDLGEFVMKGVDLLLPLVGREVKPNACRLIVKKVIHRPESDISNQLSNSIVMNMTDFPECFRVALLAKGFHPSQEICHKSHVGLVWPARRHLPD